MDEHDVDFGRGRTVGEVEIDVDHAIIRHFSEHLYSSPNKAVEELASNGFDALANRCYVYVPGDHVQNRVVVWDDGFSMNEADLQAMWRIARSPKQDLGPDRVVQHGGESRSVIGKFGIGKLASYALGHRITHLCRTQDGRFLSVSVNYKVFAADDDSERDSRADIRELTEGEVDDLIREIVPAGAARTYMEQRPHWTMAVVDDLKDVALYPGRLAWVLGNGMPLRPDFKIYVEDAEVQSKLAKDSTEVWDLSEPLVRSAINAAWASAVAEGSVSGSLAFDDGDDDVAPGVVFPELGRVTATARLFDRSLAVRPEEEGRSHGFFVMVRGRLVNADDDKLLLHDPSFGTFYRTQFVIEADGLDGELLADRESLRRDTPAMRELRVLQLGLYRPARTRIESHDEVKAAEERPESRLPVRSRDLFRDPVVALAAAGGAGLSLDLDEPVIDRVDLPAEEQLSRLSQDSGHLEVNRSHPFYAAVEAQIGSGKAAAAALRAFDLVAVAESLTEGFLRSRAVPEAQIVDLMSWRDRLLRTLADKYSRNADDLDLELRAASVPGGARFELALRDYMRAMGFSAERDGDPGMKDVLVVAPIGPDHTVFTIEAKGSKDPVENVPAALAGAAAHRDAAGATHAVVVAREFAGFLRKDRPAILKECESVTGVSVVTVETLIRLRQALDLYAYPLDTVARALFEVEPPEDKAARVAALERPLQNFPFREVLDAVWSRQAAEAARDVVPLRTVWQSNVEWRESVTYEVFAQKVAALDHLAGGLVSYNSTKETVYLTHDPAHIAEHVARSVGLIAF